MSTPSNWPRNRLLLALPAGNLRRLMPALEPIPCKEGQILLDADSSLDDVFFPDSGVVSVVAVYENGNIIEMATIGREGCTGFQAILGDRESSVRLSRSNSWQCRKDVSCRSDASNGVDAIFPKSHVCLRSCLS
jgi:hypothetical protein